jgi:hypothetical protein
MTLKFLDRHDCLTAEIFEMLIHQRVSYLAYTVATGHENAVDII